MVKDSLGLLFNIKVNLPETIGKCVLAYQVKHKIIPFLSLLQVVTVQVIISKGQGKLKKTFIIVILDKYEPSF